MTLLDLPSSTFVPQKRLWITSKSIKHFGNYVRRAILQLEIPSLDKPDDKPVLDIIGANDVNVRIWENESTIMRTESYAA